jgi:hypothetical protein
MLILTLAVVVVGVALFYHVVSTRWQVWLEQSWRSRPDPALVIKVPRTVFEGYDYSKAVAGKLSAARRELARLEAAQPARAQDAPRLRVAGGRGQ